MVCMSRLWGFQAAGMIQGIEMLSAKTLHLPSCFSRGVYMYTIESTSSLHASGLPLVSVGCNPDTLQVMGRA